MGLADGVAWERDYGAPERRTVAQQQSGVSALEAIEKAMEGVTPGPWDYFVGNANGRGLVRIEAGNDSPVAGKHIASMTRGVESEANSAFITACNPVAMREVLALARKAEALERSLRELTDAGTNVLNGLDARIQSAPRNAVPVFYGIVDLSDALNSARALLGGSENAE